MSTKNKAGVLLVLLLVLALPALYGCTSASVQAKPQTQPDLGVPEAQAPAFQ